MIVHLEYDIKVKGIPGAEKAYWADAVASGGVPLGNLPSAIKSKALLQAANIKATLPSSSWFDVTLPPFAYEDGELVWLRICHAVTITAINRRPS
jgi:hypothetical protein